MWATKVIQSGAICEKCRKWPWRLSQGECSVFQNYCSSYETCTSMCQHQLCTSTLASLKFGLCKHGCVQNQLKTQFSRHDFCLSTFVCRHKFGFSTKFSADLSLRNSGCVRFSRFPFQSPSRPTFILPLNFPWFHYRAFQRCHGATCFTDLDLFQP